MRFQHPLHPCGRPPHTLTPIKAAAPPCVSLYWLRIADGVVSGPQLLTEMQIARTGQHLVNCAALLSPVCAVAGCAPEIVPMPQSERKGQGSGRSYPKRTPITQ